MHRLRGTAGIGLGSIGKVFSLEAGMLVPWPAKVIEVDRAPVVPYEIHVSAADRTPRWPALVIGQAPLAHVAVLEEDRMPRLPNAEVAVTCSGMPVSAPATSTSRSMIPRVAHGSPRNRRAVAKNLLRRTWSSRRPRQVQVPVARWRDSPAQCDGQASSDHQVWRFRATICVASRSPPWLNATSDPPRTRCRASDPAPTASQAPVISTCRQRPTVHRLLPPWLAGSSPSRAGPFAPRRRKAMLTHLSLVAATARPRRYAVREGGRG